MKIYYRYQTNNFENSHGPNFSEYHEEEESELSANSLKRKYDGIENDIQEEWDELNEEIRKTENYLKKLERRKARIELESKVFQ